MHRRDLLKGAAALTLAPAAGGGSAFAAKSGASLRRVRPSDPAWPTEAQWAGLKRSLSGELLTPKPLLAACDAPGDAACKDALKHLGNPYFIGDQASGTQVSGYLDAWKPAASAYAVAAKTSADVAAAVTFARRRNLRLVVKGGGHSYLGTSNAPDSLLIWTRRMRAVALHDAFVPQGCGGRIAPTPAVSAGAGCVWMDLYDAVTTQAGRYVQGGGCTTVGVAGLVQSGGFGSFSKAFGTASGGLLEAEVVTADGQVRIANACTNPDLFWGLKGGGGGSLGVVTRLTLRTHELPTVLGGVNATVKASSDDAFRRLLDRFFAFYGASLMNPHWGEQVAVRPENALAISMVSLGLDSAASLAVWRPFLDWVRASPQDFKITDGPFMGALPARDWWDAEARKKRGSNSMIADDRPEALPRHAWWQGDQEQVGAFLYGYESLWMPAALLADGRRGSLVEALFAASRHMPVLLHCNKGLAGAPADAIARSADTAMNPDVLSAFALAIIATGGPPRYAGVPGAGADETFAKRGAADIALATKALRAAAPDAGAYLSESSYFQESWQKAYWGRNHARLAAVKAKYDPSGLFFVHHGVGSEAWSADGFTRLRRG